MDHYARLGVDRGAEKDEIRAAREARLAELAAEDAAERTTDEQRAANRTMMPCVSGCRSERLVLDL